MNSCKAGGTNTRRKLQGKGPVSKMSTGWECHFVTYQLCNDMQLFNLSGLQISLHLYSRYSHLLIRVLSKMAYTDCLRCWPWNKYFIQCVRKKNPSNA